MYKKQKQLMIEICHLMHLKGFICASDGNLSVKLAKNKFLITPSGINKGFIKINDLIIIDKNAKIIAGNKKHKASSEWRMHLKVYQLRPEINAVIHAHPANVVAYTIAEQKIPCCILPEAVLTMGDIPVTEYAAPTSPENAVIIEKFIKDYDAIVLKRHGSVTIGIDLISAYNKLEKIEHTAKTGIAAKILGKLNPLPQTELNELVNMGKQMGYLNKQTCCCNCNICE